MTPTLDQLKKILNDHVAWLNDSSTGCRADLSDANLIGAKLSDAMLSDAMVSGADLSGADLSRAKLRDADLSRANLSRADLIGADLNGADLRGANLSGAMLSDAELEGARGLSAFVVCPPTGAFVAYKKCKLGLIVTLQIPEDAQRVNAIGARKCRASKAIVLAISDNAAQAVSSHDSTFIYRIGDTVTVADFEASDRIECGAGINFFITEIEAKEYTV